MPIAWNEITEKSSGGTEYMARRLRDSFTQEELDHVQIIPSRVRELDDTRHRIFWCHDLPGDPESEILKDRGWSKFEKLVFVSNWQKQQYINLFQIPYNKCTVLQNAIDPFPIEAATKNNDKIRLIYHTTPHRGLDIAYHAVDKLSQVHPEIQLDVYSSFAIYGWDERDKEFQELFDAINKHDNMRYHGTVPNEDVRKAVAEAHIFAYPSTWPETSCISLMEAMSAKCLCVHSDLAALPETAANWTYMYNFTEDKNEHVHIFYACLEQAVNILKEDNGDSMNTRLMGMKSYVDLFYNWELRKTQWEQFLESFKNREPKPVQVLEPYESDEFVYRA